MKNVNKISYFRKVIAKLNRKRKTSGNKHSQN